MSTITIRINEEEKKYIEAFAKMNNKSISELIRESVLESIEDKYDMIERDKAIVEFNKEKTMYTPDEVWEILGI